VLALCWPFFPVSSVKIPRFRGFNSGPDRRIFVAVSEYLVEAYLSRAHSVRPAARAVMSKADELTREGRRVHLLHSIFVPADEICFYLFEANSGEDVVEAATRSGLQVERLMDAESE